MCPNECKWLICIRISIKKNGLKKLIHSNTNHGLRDILLGLTVSRAVFIAHWLHVALRKKSVNLLLNLLCPMSPEELKTVQLAYDNLYPKHTLVKSILGQTGGWFHKRTIQSFFTNLFEKGRASDSLKVDPLQVAKDADTLAETLSKVFANGKLEKSPCVEIFSLRSFEHLAAVASEYQVKEGKELTQVIKKSFKEQSETGNACIICIYYATRRFELFADFLDKAVTKPGKHYDMLTQIVISRAEVDLCNVLQTYGREKFREWLKKEFGSQNSVYGSVISGLCGFHDDTKEKKK